MKLSLIKEVGVGGRTEWRLEFERTTSAEKETWATESAAKREGALEAAAVAQLAGESDVAGRIAVDACGLVVPD
jgi:hypothetical protein